jgi:hypothetical protein
MIVMDKSIKIHADMSHTHTHTHTHPRINEGKTSSQCNCNLSMEGMLELENIFSNWFQAKITSGVATSAAKEELERE